MARKNDSVDPAILRQAASVEPAMISVTGRRQFEAEVLEADLPVVVDFWAPWCTPCHKMSEALYALAPMYAGKLKFVKVNVGEESNAWAAKAFKITSIPLLALFTHGELAEGKEILGWCTRQALAVQLDRLLAD